ncbi:MAG: alpha/beta fold hydrolase [Burkholderiaceae bacterium]|nr:alpha/beta fold hydrolase [Burkholderiaceae bacterium]
MTYTTASSANGAPFRPEELQTADTATLLLCLTELTHDTSHLDRWGLRIKGPTPELTEFSEEDKADIRKAYCEAASRAQGQADTGYRFDDAALNDRLFAAAAGRALPTEEQQLVLKEMGLSREIHVEWPEHPPVTPVTREVAIVGAGLSGMAMGIRLKRMGIPFTIFERNPEIGGTWWLNNYPGCGVDIASHYFSYSFAPKPDWSHYYSLQGEVLEYLRDTANEYGLREHIRFGTSIHSARYSEDTSCWDLEIDTPAGRVEKSVDVLVTAVGHLSLPKIPQFPGLDEFKGKYCHSAEWDHGIALDGKRVVLVGGGASANQIGPAIAGRVKQLTVLQRSAHWMTSVPRYHGLVTEDEKRALASIPAYARWFRARTLLSMNDFMRPAALIDPNWKGPEGTINAFNERMRNNLTAYIHKELDGRDDLIATLTPKYPPFLKRMLRDNGWYAMMMRDNVELVPDGIERFVSNGLITKSGRFIEADVVVFATGFAASDMLTTVDVEGLQGRRIREVWADENPRAHLGMSVPGFPNMFVLYGPNTNIGTGGSIFFQAEVQTAYIAQMVRNMIGQKIGSVEVRQDVHDDYNERLDARLGQMVWTLPSGDTWYRNKHGRVTSNMPWTSLEYWLMCRHPNLQDFHVKPAALAAKTSFETRALKVRDLFAQATQPLEAGERDTAWVFLHGLGGNSRVHHPLLDRVAASRPTVSLDFSGLGRSKDAMPVTFEGWLQDARECIEAAGSFRHLVLVGHSMGTVVARHLAAHDSRVVAMALLAPVPAPNPALKDAFKARADAALKSGMDAVAESFGVATLSKLTVQKNPDAVKKVKDFLRGQKAESYAKSCIALSDAAEAAAPANAECRTWVLHGDSDPFCTSESLALVERALGETRVEFTRLPGIGHWPTQEEPEATLDLIDTVLDSLEGALADSGAESV